MKVNDYVKYKERFFKVISTHGFNTKAIRVDKEETLEFGLNCYDIKLLTPEETLEMFKGRFEKLRYKFDIKHFTLHGNHDHCYEFDKTTISFLVDTFEIENNLIDLIREFQQWYWRDK